MTKEIRMSNDQAVAFFGIRISSFFRHLEFVIRHLPAFILMTVFASAAAAAKPAPKSDATIQKLLQEVPLIDGHNDLPWQFHKRSNDLSTINLNRENRDLKPPVVCVLAAD